MINRTRDDEQALQPERAWQHANTTSSDPTRWRGAWWWTSSAVASKLRANDYTERAKELPKTTCTQEWSKDTVKRHSTPPHLSREKKNYQQSKKLHKVSRLQNISKTSFGTEGLNIFWVFRPNFDSSCWLREPHAFRPLRSSGGELPFLPFRAFSPLQWEHRGLVSARHPKIQWRSRAGGREA